MTANSVHLRQATPNDAKIVAPLLLAAMEEVIFNFIGNRSRESALVFLERLIIMEETLYSYKNCTVVESNSVIIAAAIVYDGAMLYQLQNSVAQVVKEMFNRILDVEDETAAGEIYIDSVGVSPLERGKGIGTLLFEHLIERHVVKNGNTLGLLVDPDNPKAKELYLKLGFQVKGTKTLTGKVYEHMSLSSHYSYHTPL